MAYNAKTNWAIDNIVLPADMNRIEQGIKDVDTGKAPSSHTHTIANITGLQSALDGKASSSHSHSISNVSDLQSALDAKASSTHIHTPATSTSNGFMSSSDKTKLDGIGNNATETYVTDELSSTSSTIALSANQGRLLKEMIDGKAPSIHAHTNATTSSAGFMSTDDKSKLDGVAANANRTLVTDSLTSTSTTSALSANQGRVLNNNLDNLLWQMDNKLSKPGTTSSNQLNLGYMPGVHAKGTGASDYPMLRFYSATGDVLGSISVDSSFTTLRSWSGSVFIQASDDGIINFNTSNDSYVKVNGISVALKSDLANVATVKVGTGVPSASSLEDGDIYIQY